MLKDFIFWISSGFDMSFTKFVPLGFSLIISMAPVAAVSSDLDADSVDAMIDNCPSTANLEQEDADQDGMGDVCDITPGWDGPLGAIDGEGYKKLFGVAVGFVGDLNGDGRDEIIVGSPKSDKVLKNEEGKIIKTVRNVGSVRVISPVNNNAVLYEFFGDRAKDAFGAAVLGVGDINGDSVPDFVVGAPGADVTVKPVKAGAGRVVAYSGADGAVLFDVYGEAAGDALGFSLSALGDYDGSGVDDVLVGAPLSSPMRFGTTTKLKKAGKVQILAGEDGQFLRTVKGQVAGGQLGFSVAGMQDLNADGQIDFAAGAPYQSVSYLDPNNKPAKAVAAGSVAIFSGQNGQELGRIENPGAGVGYPMPGAHFGWSLADMGDQDGDGVVDIAIGAPDALGDAGAGYTEKGAGVVKVMTVSGFHLGRFSYGQRGAHVGYSVANGGDINGDGRDDVVIGSPWEVTTAAQTTVMGGAMSIGSVNVDNWSIELFGGATESAFMERSDADSMRNMFGAAVAGRGRVTGKGNFDVIIGAPNAGDRYGSVFLWRHVAR